ncbi:ribosome biogenesis GTP-binding protein YihA/YsxC [Varunaivibrio sulfuroxidans]|uniref:Probable GTP-binding protein EngB n=1 Tax=Varunaivibrio sulfuroxidans TaxID=1773489 RepID=A0A4R3JFU8_9PROT|nr:ribosome biogenesis GTP-binding protein YihA/YsxC [Varunaivibrio sulfuroxidans]TCS65008.1 GTP-binding protein [Varunaivibrio sulfuroxidans]WES29701.1 ribosome biogenesis GTP-binding protein YihA/YsxC [Varunaivibrio sulfuroxidans]
MSADTLGGKASAPVVAPAATAEVGEAHAFEAGEVEEGRLLFARECVFVLGMASLHQIPDPDLPEIAFAGRSNVGKSSLINALTGRKGLARTSNTPGRTQQINFFNLDRRLMIADLPGYGYARAPKDQVEKWTRLVNAYLKGRQPLVRTFLLIDARHGVKDVDLKILDMLDRAAQVYQVVLTKCDKIKATALRQLVARTEQDLAKRPALFPRIVATSSEKGIGIAGLRAEIAALAPSRRA